MEKYTKFDDPRTGVNPFVPNPVPPRSCVFKAMRLGFMLVLVLVKLVLLLVVMIPFRLLHLAKYIVLEERQ
jgi:hypothetical protein